MKRFLCRWRGHRWENRHWPTFYTCTRCHEVGFWVPEAEQ